MKIWTSPESGLSLLVAYVVLCGGIFALQLAPVVGVFLMILAAPFWIGLLVHLAMVQFAWHAILGSISRVWLALPLAFYAGGFALHLVSVYAARTEAAAINARNAAVQLNVGRPFRYLRDGNADSSSLIERYRADRSYIRQPSGEITTYYYARGPECDNALQGYYHQRRNEPWAFRSDIFSHYQGRKSRQCILSQSDSSADWRYRITANYTYAKDRASWLFTRYGKTFEIFDDRSKSLLGTIEVATFYPLSAVPWIVAGCALNSGAAKWQCGWSLTKGGTAVAAGYKSRAANDPQKNPFTPSLDAETWEVTPLAKALGLEPRKPTD